MSYSFLDTLYIAAPSRYTFLAGDVQILKKGFLTVVCLPIVTGMLDFSYSHREAFKRYKISFG